MKNENEVSSFSEAKVLILKEVKDIRGDRDEDIRILKEFEEKITESKKNGQLNHFLCSIPSLDSSIFEKELDVLIKGIQIKQKILSVYRGTDISHIVQELIRAANSVGFSFFVNDNELYLGVDSKYIHIDRWEIEDFVLKEFFTAAKVDMRKQTFRSCDEVIANLFAFADRITLEKLKGK